MMLITLFFSPDRSGVAEGKRSESFLSLSVMIHLSFNVFLMLVK